jgi:hypothetical protein
LRVRHGRLQRGWDIVWRICHRRWQRGRNKV